MYPIDLRQLCRAWLWSPRRWLRRSFIAAFFVAAGVAQGAEVQPENKSPRTDFMPAVELAPFVVKGEKLSISILARSKADRRYAEKFAEDVMEVVYATLEKPAGAGLVIIGEEGEPHPVFVFRKFVALAESGELDPAFTTRAKEVGELMRNWELRLNLDQASKDGLPVEAFLKALPLPLEGAASKLYQLAWEEGFDETRVEKKLRTLTPADIGTGQLARFDWVFYLPPREAFGEAMKDVLPAMMKKQKMGLMKRAAIRGAMVAFGPAVKKAVEGMRKGMLFMTVMRARSGYSDEDVQQLTGAYVRTLMPDFKFNDGSTHERAIAAIEKQKLANAEYAKNPFVTPQRLVEFDPAAYAKFEGSYAENAQKRETSHRFVRSGDGFAWQYREQKPRPFFPAGDRLFVSEDGKMTTEFLVDEAGAVTGVEERWHRRRKVLVPANSALPNSAQSEEDKTSVPLDSVSAKR